MSAEPKDRKANRRGAARLAAVQALYQMDIAATPLNEPAPKPQPEDSGQGSLF